MVLYFKIKKITRSNKKGHYVLLVIFSNYVNYYHVTLISLKARYHKKETLI